MLAAVNCALAACALKAAPATQPARQSRLWNAGGPAGLAALGGAERQAQLRHALREAAAERSARAWDNSEIVLDLRLAD